MLVIAGVFVLILPPSSDWARGEPFLQDVSHLKGVLFGLRAYAADHEGRFPWKDHEGKAFSTSTEAFQHLMTDGDFKSDQIFWVLGNPEKRAVPIADGILTSQECSFSYVSSQMSPDWSTSPLVAHEMNGVGTFGRNHPYLRRQRAVVGYVGGHARVELLSSRRPGATIPGPPGSGIDNIFEEGTKLEDGTFKGGYLAVPTSNLLHPQ